MNDLPSLVIWPKDIERPKTLYLKKGLISLGIPIRESKKWINVFNPQRNSRGPYVYPIEFHFGERRQLIWYDIHTNPNIFYPQFMKPHWVYFKTHFRKKDQNKFPRVIVAPNSVSNPDLYFKALGSLRIAKHSEIYHRDFLFIGWNDDKGLRMETVKKVKKMKINSLAGLLPFKHHTTVPKQLLGQRMEYLDHLNSQVRSKINLALPGGFHLPYCSFRHVELLGMGCFILTCPCDSVLPGNPKGIWAEYNLQDLEKVIQYYLNHDFEREAIAAKGRAYFDEYLTPEKNAQWIINRTIQRMVQGMVQ